MALPQSLWSELTKKVMESSPTDVRWQRTVLKFVSTAHEVDLDPHGRVLVPPTLRAWAGLSKDVVWVGMGKFIQLWDSAALEQARVIGRGDSVALDFLGETLGGDRGGDFVETVVLDREALAGYRNSFPAHLDADEFELR